MVKNKEKDSRSFFQRMRFKYRVSILDENTLEEAWHTHISRLNIFLYLCGFIVLTFFILAALIYVTPLRYYLPGYGDSGNRELVIYESMRADSLQRSMDLQIRYLDVIKNAIEGSVKPEEIGERVDTMIIFEDKKDGLSLDKTEREGQFVGRYEEEEKYNLSILDSPTKKENVYVFLKPVKGIIERRYNAAEDIYGITVITSPNENVFSVQDGTVIYADFSFNSGWVIQVQHEGNYVSIYKNNTRLLKKAGDSVRAGEIIAITGDAGDKETHFYFELWNNGNTINPQDIIIF